MAIDQRLLVDSIEHWSKEMQETKIRSVDKIERPIRRRSWKLGLAAAVVTTVAVGIGIWLASGGETETPVIDQPLPTVATPEPTAASLEVVQQALGLYEAGDIDGWQALWAPEATWEVITPVGDAFSAHILRAPRDSSTTHGSLRLQTGMATVR